MDRKDIVEIAEGLKLIEEGVSKIQDVMRAKNFKSIRDMAEELIPIFKQTDDELTESIIRRLD